MFDLQAHSGFAFCWAYHGHRWQFRPPLCALQGFNLGPASLMGHQRQFAGISDV